MGPKDGKVVKQVRSAARRSGRKVDTVVHNLQQHQQPQQQPDALSKAGDFPPRLPAATTLHDDKKTRDAIAKLSNVQLSEEQKQLRDNVLRFCRNSIMTFRKTQRPSVFIIQGDAGTGKSVVLNALFNELQRQSRLGEQEKQKAKSKPKPKPKSKAAEAETGTEIGTETGTGTEESASDLAGTENYLVVNHPEMLKLYHRISSQFPYIRKADLERPTLLINRLRQSRRSHEELADVILVDEAHLLLSKKNAYKRFFGNNQLEELMKLAKAIVIIFDGKQSLRFDAHWDDTKLEDFLVQQSKSMASVSRYYLRQQFRVTAAPDMQRWIQALSVDRKILPRPRTDAERRAAGDLDAYDFRIYEDAGELYRALMQRNAECGGARLLSTYDYPYRLPRPGQGGEGQKIWYVDCGKGFRIPWDKYMPQISEPWSEQPDSYKYCGSVYTIQGFDLTYAGVILGPSVGYDKASDTIIIRPQRYEDHAAFMGRKNDETAAVDKERIILNSINVLLTRGVHGLYLFAYDPELRRRLMVS